MDVAVEDLELLQACVQPNETSAGLLDDDHDQDSSVGSRTFVAADLLRLALEYAGALGLVFEIRPKSSEVISENGKRAKQAHYDYYHNYIRIFPAVLPGRSYVDIRVIELPAQYHWIQVGVVWGDFGETGKHNPQLCCFLWSDSRSSNRGETSFRYPGDLEGYPGYEQGQVVRIKVDTEERTACVERDGQTLVGYQDIGLENLHFAVTLMCNGLGLDVQIAGSGTW